MSFPSCASSPAASKWTRASFRPMDPPEARRRSPVLPQPAQLHAPRALKLVDRLRRLQHVALGGAAIGRLGAAAAHPPLVVEDGGLSLPALCADVEGLADEKRASDCNA